jgi:hypothetical protein
MDTLLVVSAFVLVAWPYILYPWFIGRAVNKLIFNNATNYEHDDFDKLVAEASSKLKNQTGKSFKKTYRNRVHLAQVLSGLRKEYKIEAIGGAEFKAWKSYQVLYKLTKRLPWYYFLDNSGRVSYLVADYSHIRVDELEKDSNFDIKFGGNYIKGKDGFNKFCVPVSTRLQFISANEEEEYAAGLMEKHTVISIKKEVDYTKGKPFVLVKDPVFNNYMFEQRDIALDTYLDDLVINKSYVNVPIKSGEKKYNVPMSVIAKEFLFKIIEMKGDTNHLYAHGPVGSGKSGILKIAASQAEKHLENGTVVIYINVAELKSISATVFKTALADLMSSTKAENILFLVDEADSVLTSKDVETSSFSGFILSLMNGVDQNMFNATFLFAGKKPYEDISDDFKRRIGFPFSIPSLPRKEALELFKLLEKSPIKEGHEPQVSELNDILSKDTTYSIKEHASLYEVFVLCFSRLDKDAEDAIEELLQEHHVETKAASTA